MRHTAPTISIDGTAISEQLRGDLLELRVVRGTRSTGRATLTFVDRTFDLARSKLKLGSEVKLSSIEPAAELFEGKVTGVTTESGGDGAIVTITAHDASHAMARTQDVASFANQGPADVIKEIASAAGLSTELPSSPISDKTRDLWAWRADSLLGQLDELCERLGWDWTIVGKKLRCVDIAKLTVPSSTSTLRIGAELDRFSAEQSGPVTTQVTVRGWDETTKQAFEETARTPATSSGFQAAKSGPAEGKHLVTRRGALTQSEAKSLAGALAAATASVTARGRGRFSALVEPGKGVTIDGAGPSDGDYYVREVEHVYDLAGFRTSFVAGFRDPVRISGAGRQRRSASSVLATGLHVAIVDDNADPKFPGKVKVNMPAVSASDSLRWARIAVPGGGAQRGMHWTPEVGDEVIVAFEDGDVRRPVVLGGLYNGKDKAPVAEPVKNGKVLTRTLTSRLGHKLEMGDGEGDDAKYIDLELTGGKVRLHLGADRIDLETADKPLRIASGKAEIVFDGKGGITIKGTEIKIEAQTEIAAKGTAIKAKATGQLELQGSSTTVKADAALKLQSSGIAELAGSLVKIN